MKTILELKQELGRLYDEARAIVELADTEKRAITTEEDTQYTDIVTRMDALRLDIEKREKLEGFKGVERPQSGGNVKPHSTKTTPDSAQGIFFRYLRTGDEGAQRELNPAVAAEYRASNATDMNITTAADGGDLVPVGHYQGIIEKARPAALYNRLGLRQIPGVGTTVNVPVDNEADNGAFVSTAESALFDLDSPAVSKISMTLVKYTKRVVVTYELLQDEDSRLMEFLNGYVASGYAATLNTLMVTEALANGTAGLTLDSATAIGAGEIPELLYKLPAVYASGANLAWLMRRATEGYIRGLASASLFTFAPTPGGSGSGLGIDSLLWGVPAYSDDNTGALAASGKSLIIANWNYMAIRLDPSMTFLRDPFTRSSYGEIVLNYYFRVDFAVLQAAAFQYASHPTA